MIAELVSEYAVHVNQISMWKKQLLDAAPDAFSCLKDKGAEKKEIELIICFKNLSNCRSKLIG